MPLYEIYKRDGTPVRVEGPEGATTRDLLKILNRPQTTPSTSSEDLDPYLRQLSEIARQRPVTLGQQIQEIPKGIGSGVASLLESAALGTASFVLPEQLETPVREGIQSVGEGVQSFLAPDANIQARMEQDNFELAAVPRKFSEALGSFAGILGTAAVNPIAAGALAVGAGAGEASERAREKDATEQERKLARILGAGVGATELISPTRILSNFRKGVGGEVSDKIVDRAKRIAAEGTVEGLQEFGATVGQNLIEQGIYNPEQGTFTASGEAFGYGAGVGGFVQAFVEMIAPRRRGTALALRPTGTDVVPTETSPEVPPEPLITPVPKKLTDQREPLQLEAPSPLALRDTRGDIPIIQRDARGDIAIPLGGATETDNLVKQAEELRNIISQGQKEDTAIAGAMVTRAKKDLADVNRQISAVESRKGFDPAEKQKQEQQFVEMYGKQADEANLNREGIYKNLDALFKGEGDSDARKTKPRTSGVGIPSDVEYSGRPTSKDPDAITSPIRERLGETGPPISDDTGRDGQQRVTLDEYLADKRAKDRAERAARRAERIGEKVEPLKVKSKSDPAFMRAQGYMSTAFGPVGRLPTNEEVQKYMDNPTYENANKIRDNAIAEAKGLTATETGKVAADKGLTATETEKSGSFVFGARKGEVTKKALSGFDSAKLAQFMPLPREEIDARINNLAKNVKSNTPKAYVLSKIDPRFQYIDFMERTTKAGKKIKDEQTESDAKKKKLELAKKRTEGIKGASKFEKSLNLEERNKRIELNKQFKDRFDKKADLVEKAQARGFKPEEIILVSEGSGDRTVRSLESEPRIDPTTSRDKRLILNLLESKPKVKDKDAQAAKMYFGKVGSILQGLEQIISDAKYQKKHYRKEQKDKQKNPETLEGFITFLSYKGLGAKTYTSKQQRILRLQEYIEDKFAEGTGAEKARQALKWMKDNLTDATNEYIATRLSEETAKKLLSEEFLDHSMMYLPSENIHALAYPLSPNVQGLLREGDLKNTLLTMPLPETIKNLGKVLSDNIGDTKIKIRAKLADGMAGAFDPSTNTIELSATEGMNSHVLLHEVAHAVTSHTLVNKSHPVTMQLNTLFNDVKGSLGTARGAKDLDEFIAEAFSNPKFQGELASINPKGKPINGFQRFVNIIANMLRRLFGAKQKPLDALEVISDHVEAIVSPAPKYRDALKLSMFTTRDGALKFMKTFSQNLKANYPRGENDPTLRQYGGTILYELSRNARKLSLQVLGSQALGDVARSVGFENLGNKLHRSFEDQRGDMDKADKVFTEVAEEVSAWFKSKPQLVKHLNDVIYHPEYGSTLYQVDPNKQEKDYRKKNGEPKIDKDGNDLAEVWRKQNKVWSKLDKKGQDTYNRMQSYYKKLHAELKAVIFGEIDNAEGLDVSQKTELKNDIFKKLFEKNTLAIYFPLMREGNYKLSYRLKAKDERTDEEIVSGAPEKSRDPFAMQMFETISQRDAEIKRLEETGEVVKGSFKKSDSRDVDRALFENAPSNAFVSRTLNILDAGKVDKDIKDQFMRLFIETLPETSFAKSLQPRKGTPGHMRDSLEAFKTKGFDLGRQIARIKNGSKIRRVESEIRDKAKNPDAKVARSIVGKVISKLEPTIKDMETELLTRAKFARMGAGNKNFERWVKTANQTAFIYTIGTNPSSAVVNLTQIPVFVYPFLSGQFGIPKTTKQLKNAYKLVQQSGRSLDVFYNIDKETGDLSIKDDIDKRIDRETLERIKPIVKAGLQRGQLNRSFIADTLGLNERGRKQKGSLLDKASGLSAIMFNAAERLNRQVTMLASFELVLDTLKTKKKEGKPFPSKYEGKLVFPQKMSTQELETLAAEEALYMTQQTNGGAVLETAPRLAQEGIGRVAMMYKTFGAQMYYTMLKTAKIALDSDKSLSSEERRTAFKQLIGLHGTAFFVAGIHGLPLYGAIKVISNLFLDDDEDDFDTLVRKQFGELGYKGLIAEYAGIDVSDRVKMTGLLFQENRYNTDKSAEEIFGGVIGGPALSVLKKLGRGATDIWEGEYERGIESLLPTGMANFWKYFPSVGRVGREGYRTRRGDPIYDDVTGGELLWHMFGFPPTEYTFRQEQNQDIVALGKALSEKRSKLLKKLYMAWSNFDYDEEEKVRKDILAFNDKVFVKFPDAIIDPDTEEKSLKKHQQTSVEMHNGIIVNPLIRKDLFSILREYD